MKFAFYADLDRPYNGLINAISQFGPTLVWNSQKCIFDMLDELQPDVVVFREKNRPDQADRAIAEFKKTKFISLPSDYPKIAANVWDVPICKTPSYDLLVVGEKDSDLEFFAPLIQNRKSWAIKIVGEHPFPIPEYIGKLDNSAYISLIDQAKLVTVFNEQAIYNLAARRCCVLSPVKTELYPVVDSHVELAVDSLLNGPQREKLADKAYNKVINGNTYYDRALAFTKKYKLDIPEINYAIEKIRNSC